jgi:VanZ family protein
MAESQNPRSSLGQRIARIAFWFAAVFAFVMAVLPHPPRLPGEPSDKVLHVLAFVTLGILAAFGFRARSAWFLFAALAGFGAIIEIVQAIPLLNRDSELADWLADMVAALAALVLTRWLISRHARRRARQAP